MERTRDFRESVLQSDVIIYDLMTNKFEEVDYVIKTLKTSKLDSQKTLILLSSVMTWVNTPPKEKKEGEEAEKPAETVEAKEEVEEVVEAKEEVVEKKEKSEKKSRRKHRDDYSDDDYNDEV